MARQPAARGSDRRRLVLAWMGHGRHKVVNYAAMSEMSVRLDPPVSNAVLVGVIAQDRDDVETAPLPALRLAGMGRGIAAKS